MKKMVCFAGAVLVSISGLVYAEKKLLLFGDENRDVFLGCYNCSSVASDSIHNTVSKYGSSVSSLSIFNSVGKYGSSVSTYSPCNTVGSKPPAVVDSDGNFYGYLTLNTVYSKAIEDDAVLSWLRNKVCK